MLPNAPPTAPPLFGLACARVFPFEVGVLVSDHKALRL
jgi:hypothetical protein